jgi:excinuclease ABC subunit A
MAAAEKKIELRGVRVNNLKNIDLEIPHGQLVVVCGPSGSGKSSLVTGTLFCEGQRRYVETFSPYARQFMDQVERPAAERMLGIPPAIGYVSRPGRFGRRATIASTIEFLHHLQLLFTRIAEVICPKCERLVEKHNPQSIADWVESLATGNKLQVGFLAGQEDRHSVPELQGAGFVRAIVGESTVALSELSSDRIRTSPLVIVDRFVAGKVDRQRLLDSLTTAFDFGSGALVVLVESNSEADKGAIRQVDGGSWIERRFFRELVCPICFQRFAEPDLQRLSDSSPLGACPKCEGLGSVSEYDMAKIVPDEEVSIRDGAIAPWNSPNYVHERDELLALAPAYKIPVDVPFKELSKAERQLIWDGVPERKFGGLAGFFRWVEKKRYKMHMRIFAARWKSFHECEQCHGRRWREEALVYRVQGRHIADLTAMSLASVSSFLQSLLENADEPSASGHAVSRGMLTGTKSLSQKGSDPLCLSKGLTPFAIGSKPISHSGKLIVRRLLEMTEALNGLGLGNLELNRPMQSLSGGEQQRLMIGRLLRSSLVNLVYVFDEPTTGLHPYDAEQIVQAIQSLRDRHNTVVVADHSPQMIALGERVVELGPGAGDQGGTVVFDGRVAELKKNKDSATGRLLATSKQALTAVNRRVVGQSRIRLLGCSGRNLQNLDVDFPLGVFCQVVGVSGSGKATLVRDTLYAAVAHHFGDKSQKPLPVRKLTGEDRVEGVVLVDDTPLTRSGRSNPVTFIKSFDLIRQLFAESEEARTQNLKAGHFSFNIAGGRCEKCAGEGFLTVDMHFLSDMRVICDECQGARFRLNVLKAKYRGKNIQEVLELTVQQAFPFFRGQKKIQVALKSLMDAGLGYLRLGQPLSTLSHGEERRLKLAQHLQSTQRGKKLFVVIKPTMGLHGSEIARLVDCFDSLLSVGHSVVVVDNHPRLAEYADWLIELGPGAGQDGGQVIFTGTPEEMVDCERTVLGKWLNNK